MGVYAFPFALGLVAAFNPCGFALLPVYLSYFLGVDGDKKASRLATIVRGLVVGLVMTAGFVAVFGICGVAFETIISEGTVFEYTGYVTIAIGVLMLPLGVFMALGKDFVLRLPKLNLGTGSRDLSSVFLFGVSYAVVSLSCTIGLFLSSVTTSFTTDGWLEGLGNFLAYALGMGALITFLTMSLALAKTDVAKGMRQVLPYVGRFSGFVLLIAGLYLIDYGYFEIRVLSGSDYSSPRVDRFLEMQAAVNNWIQDTTPERIAVISVLGVIGALIIGWRDLESDRVKRISVSAGYICSYLIIEFLFNEGEFIFLPLVRFIGGWPLRIAHWFSDPLRFGVPIEAAFTALVVWLAWRRIARYLRARNPLSEETATESGG
ncbi:MAG: cytochrome c biogenesis protein CcdA [Acidimicrobiaceae bacterium]|nr:cytochrome c biogenesis protein CcdA [Acidimicrobiaceae bacterium]MYD08332.1 cytochrome c biogenesis protein CcdA [Acidimicrobiaceae bacterium]MYI58647.1 cytochrome c biogenesis protein CcdA [Acidimicrobiaceae bacterium]